MTTTSKILLCLFFVLQDPDTGVTSFSDIRWGAFPKTLVEIRSSRAECIFSSNKKSVIGGNSRKKVPSWLLATKQDSEPRKSRTNQSPPWYWADENDEKSFLVTYDPKEEKTGGWDDSEGAKAKRVSKLRFRVRGNPRPLQRHRSSRGHTYNPSLKYQRSFIDAFETLMLRVRDEKIPTPIFEENEHLAMTIIFRMKRPKSHFVNNRPGPGRLKEKAPPQLSSIRTDVDNLTKFVLDSMNGILYEDDRQVTSIKATKLLDNNDLCHGSIDVCVRSINEDDVEHTFLNE